MTFSTATRGVGSLGLSRLDELVSDWELEEIRHELSVGTAPDIIEFRHGLPKGTIGRRKAYKGVQDHSSYRMWDDAERAFVRDNYPQHGTSHWTGWKLLRRSWHSIEKMAHELGVTKKQRERPWSDLEISFLKDNFPNHDRHWEGWNLLNRTWGAIMMKASYLNVRRKRKTVNEEWRKMNEELYKGEK